MLQFLNISSDPQLCHSEIYEVNRDYPQKCSTWNNDSPRFVLLARNDLRTRAMDYHATLWLAGDELKPCYPEIYEVKCNDSSNI